MIKSNFKENKKSRIGSKSTEIKWTKVYNPVLSGTKYEGDTKDFEIDWMVLSEGSLFVFEVDVRGAEEADQENGFESMISKNIRQIAKDQIVIDHLLQVSGVNQMNVFYPFIRSFIRIFCSQRVTRVKEHITFLNDLVGPKASRLKNVFLCLSSTLHEDYSSSKHHLQA